MTSTIEESIEIDVPARTAYDQWTQLETLPRFVPNLELVQQLDDAHARWRARVGGQTLEWDAEISEQVPDKRIAWHSTSGTRNAGVVTFHRLSDARSKVMLQIDYEPEGVLAHVGDARSRASRTSSSTAAARQARGAGASTRRTSASSGRATRRRPEGRTSRTRRRGGRGGPRRRRKENNNKREQIRDGEHMRRVPSAERDRGGR